MKVVNDYVMYAMLGVVGHAVGHFLISHSMTIGIYPEGGTRGIDDLKESSIALATFKILPGYLFFWVPLLKSYMQNSGWTSIFIFAAIAVAGSLMLPLRLGFAFAQCFFFLGLSIDQLCSVSRERKTFAYALYPFVTVLPSVILSMLECTRCSSSGSFWAAYGHVLYDSFMALSYPLFYALCSLYYNKKDGAGDGDGDDGGCCSAVEVEVPLSPPVHKKNE